MVRLRMIARLMVVHTLRAMWMMIGTVKTMIRTMGKTIVSTMGIIMGTTHGDDDGRSWKREDVWYSSRFSRLPSAANVATVFLFP